MLVEGLQLWHFHNDVFRDMCALQQKTRYHQVDVLTFQARQHLLYKSCVGNSMMDSISEKTPVVVLLLVIQLSQNTLKSLMQCLEYSLFALAILLPKVSRNMLQMTLKANYIHNSME